MGEEIVELRPRGRGLRATVRVRVWSPGGDPRPLLVAHDGPELEDRAGLTEYAARMIAAGELPPHRIALVAPGHRDEWYSGSALYARALVTDVLPALGSATAPVGMGVSLGALAMLHAHARAGGAFAALFLQSGSFFVPRFDAHEARFPRYRRVVRVVRELHRDSGPPVPVTLTCGATEENLRNNRAMARALVAQGFEATLHEVDGHHDFAGWGAAIDPHLTRLLARTWA
jgi:enterochelin esterase-like enzyme